MLLYIIIITITILHNSVRYYNIKTYCITYCIITNTILQTYNNTYLVVEYRMQYIEKKITSKG